MSPPRSNVNIREDEEFPPIEFNRHKTENANQVHVEEEEFPKIDFKRAHTEPYVSTSNQCDIDKPFNVGAKEFIPTCSIISNDFPTLNNNISSNMNSLISPFRLNKTQKIGKNVNEKVKLSLDMQEDFKYNNNNKKLTFDHKTSKGIDSHE